MHGSNEKPSAYKSSIILPKEEVHKLRRWRDERRSSLGSQKLLLSKPTFNFPRCKKPTLHTLFCIASCIKMKMNKREILLSFTGLAHIYRGAPPPPPQKKKKGKQKKGKTERVLKQKLLKAITKVQGQNVIVSAILARVSIIQKFPCWPTMVASNSFQCSTWPLHFEIHFTSPVSSAMFVNRKVFTHLQTYDGNITLNIY